jgi:pilus assembly protein Flp/PilA
MWTLIGVLAADEGGATAIEYGLIASLVAAVIIAGVALLGTNVSTMYSNIAGQIAAASPSS